MTITIQLAIRFRKPTADEIVQTNDALPRFVSDRDAMFLCWCDGGLPMSLRNLWGMLEDGETIGIDDAASKLSKDIRLAEALARHLFFGDARFTGFDRLRCRFGRRRDELVCTYLPPGEGAM